MIKSEINKHNMYKAVLTSLRQSQGSISKIPVFAKVVDEFAQKIKEIEELDITYQNVRKGAFDHKERVRGELIEAHMKLSSAIYVYGKRNEIFKLTDRTKVNRSKLKTARELDFLQWARILFNDAQENKEALVDFGIDEKEIEKLGNLVQAFEDAMKSMSVKTARRSSSRERLRDLFNEVDEIVKDSLDRLIELIKDEDDSGYMHYQASRMIKDL